MLPGQTNIQQDHSAYFYGVTMSKPKQKKTFRREVLEIIAAFVIAWLAYQLISLAAGTPLPIVSVVSDSMYHTSYFDAWWEQADGDYVAFDVTKEGFMKFPNANGLSRGDLLLVVRPDSPKIGDILIYRKLGSDFTIVHRLVKIENNTYIVKGDNNRVADPPVARDYAVGKVVFAMPVLGYPRLLLHLVGI